jgi:hypothetical protein
MKATRGLMAISVVAAAGVAMAMGVAQAAPQAGEPITTHLAAKDYCGFPVTVVNTSNQELRGGGKFTGPGDVTVTNDQTGKTITYNVSGPGTVTSTPDGGFAVDATGTNFFWTTAKNSYPGVPTISYTTGHLQFTVNKSGKTTSYSTTGNTTDVCAALS